MLCDQWGDMRSIFVDLLNVLTSLSIWCMVKSRSSATESHTGVSEAKETLGVLSSFLEAGEGQPSDPKDLLKARIFPVRQPQGTVELVTADVEFAIPDRKHWAEAFGGKVRILDFSLGEVQRLKPLLRWAGLESRYLSAAVQEGSGISRLGCAPLRDSRKDIPPKAHALFRYESSLHHNIALVPY